MMNYFPADICSREEQILTFYYYVNTATRDRIGNTSMRSL